MVFATTKCCFVGREECQRRGLETYPQGKLSIKQSGVEDCGYLTSEDLGYMLGHPQAAMGKGEETL